MRALFPSARVMGYGEPVPQHPGESQDFWPIWEQIVAEAHPEPIDLLFVGESYGAELARPVGGRFVPLGGRFLDEDRDGPGGVSGIAVRADPAANWHWLPPVVRRDLVRTVSLHGVESTGKSSLAARLAQELGTIWVPEYGRSHCMVHGTDCTRWDLETIAAGQQAMIDAARPWSGPILLTDTDWVMTRAWHRMMLGTRMAGSAYPLADLYILLSPDMSWIDDGLRLYGDEERRRHFDRLCREELEAVGARWIEVSGDWDSRHAGALAAINAL
jgi:NadR type nicotinamide-nucleotide adenylyltransferase